MTDRYVDDFLVSEEDDAFLDGTDRLHLIYSEAQRMIYVDMLKYEVSTLRWLTDGMIQDTVESLFKTAAKKGWRKFSVLSKKLLKILSGRL